MSRLVWDKVGERIYETGVDRMVLYRYDTETHTFKNPVAWNGITAFNESPSGAEPSPLWADNIKYLNLMSAEEYGATLEAYTYPDEFEECDGSKELAPGVMIGQQSRKLFALCYRTLLGNDTEGTDLGYKLHIAWLPRLREGMPQLMIPLKLRTRAGRSPLRRLTLPDPSRPRQSLSTPPRLMLRPLLHLRIFYMEPPTLKGAFRSRLKLLISSAEPLEHLLNLTGIL